METPIFPIEITPAALDHVRRLIVKDGRPDVFLRLGVKGGGCSGLEYVMKLDIVRKPIDLELVIDGITIVCDSKSAGFLAGSTFDFPTRMQVATVVVARASRRNSKEAKK